MSAARLYLVDPLVEAARVAVLRLLALALLVVVPEGDEEIVARLEVLEDPVQAAFLLERAEREAGAREVAHRDALLEERRRHLAPASPRLLAVVGHGGVARQIDGGRAGRLGNLDARLVEGVALAVEHLDYDLRVRPWLLPLGVGPRKAQRPLLPARGGRAVDR